MTTAESGFLTNERLSEALDTNPFTSVIEKFYQKYDGSSESLDEIYANLLVHPEIDRLKKQLAELPKYTTVYRYDPFSVRSSGDKGGCFGYDQPYGASTAYLRLFDQLHPDNVQIVRTDDEVMVVIDHPSTLLIPGNKAIDSNDPTVLFTSRQFEGFGSSINRSEDREFGLLINYGDTLTKASPPTRLVSNSLNLEYLFLSRKNSQNT